MRQSLLSIKCSVNQHCIPKGSTTLINQLFGRDFSPNEDSFLNQETVEIQNDLNCAKVYFNTVADSHGGFDIEDDKQINSLFPLFSTVIVHCWEKDTETNRKVTKLIEKHKGKKFILLQYTSDRDVKKQGYIRQSNPLHFRVTDQ